MLNARIADHYILTLVRWLNRQDRILCHYQLVPAGRASSEKSYLLLHASLDPRTLVDNAVICKSTPGQLVNNGQQSTWGEEKSGLRWATKEARDGNKGGKRWQQRRQGMATRDAKEDARMPRHWQGTDKESATRSDDGWEPFSLEHLPTVTTCPIISHQSGYSYMQIAKCLHFTSMWSWLMWRGAHRDCTENLIQKQYYTLCTWYSKNDNKMTDIWQHF